MERNGRIDGVFNGGAWSRPVLITALVSGLAASALTGCQSGNSNNRFSKGDNLTREGMAARASAKIDPGKVTGQYDANFYSTQANQIALPDRWLSEAQTLTAETEARRAAAQAAEIKAFADQAQSFAEQDAMRQSAFSDKRVGEIDSKKLREVFNAKIAEEESNANTHALLAQAESAHRNKVLASQILEWRSEVDKLRAQAGTEWSQAQAEHTRMLAERSAVANRGSAQIAHMTNVADMTAEKATSQVAALRAEARAAGQKAQAEAQQIEQQVQTVRAQTDASSSELRQKIDSISRESNATVSQLRARAKALEQQDVNETFRLDLSMAESSFERNRADGQRLVQAAEARAQSVAADAERQRAEARKQLELDRNDYESSLASIRAFVDHGKAEFAVRRVQAQKIEKDARAEFVRAEVEARSNAIREQSRHQFVLAEEEARRIRAEAEAEASRIRSAFVATFAKQMAAGQVDMPTDFSDPKKSKPSANDSNPTMKRAGARNPVVEPEYVARFKASLAESEKIRMQSDADEKALFATAEERAASFEAWWRQQQSKHDTAIAQANGLHDQANADISRQVAEAEGRLKQADVLFTRAKSEAEQNKQQTLAQIVNLNAEADLIDRKANATLSQLRAQLEATTRNGESEIRSLQVALSSTRERGDATSKRLTAEADSLDRSQKAVVAQMRKEIDSARQILNSELARMQQSAESYYAVAQATFNETVAAADALAKVSEANMNEAIASNEASHTVAMANVDFRRNVNNANRMLAEAAVNRRSADAEMQFAMFDANDSTRRHQIAAETQMALAATNAQFQVAAAEDDATFARFSARVAMTESDRNRAYADLYLDNQQKRARVQQAVAAANAYRELSFAAINRLNERTRSFEVAAKENWFSGLAMPASFPYPEAKTDLYDNADRFLGSSVADVPVND